MTTKTKTKTEVKTKIPKADLPAVDKSITFEGVRDYFELVCRTTLHDIGVVKTTRAMEIEGTGVVLQVTSERDGSIEAESVVFVPRVKLVRTVTGAMVVPA